MSKRFSFRLQPVLEWRQQQADTLEGKAAQQERLLQDIGERIEFLRQSVRQAFNAGAEQGNPFWQSNLSAYVQSLRNQESELQKLYEKQYVVVQQARLELGQARIKQKSLEMLKEKQRKAEIAETQKAEEQFLNEWSLQMGRR